MSEELIAYICTNPLCNVYRVEFRNEPSDDEQICRCGFVLRAEWKLKEQHEREAGLYDSEG